MTLDNVQALPLGAQLGDFRLDAVIGHGGFGITYRAFDRQLAKVVAIKEFLPVDCAVRQGQSEVVPRGARFADDFAWGRDRFLDEARALARFRHPHIVPVLRYFEANGTAYTVMEFEDGRNLAELLRERGKRLAPDDVRRLADGLLSGLGAVHAQGFLHRDIKPSNIIIRRDGVPILIDFGAARQAMGGRTRTLTGILTPQYAPIEQYALDGKQGPWSDIYSAAAVLHHAVTGEPPPEAASRVGRDPYKPLVGRAPAQYEDVPFLAAIDKGLAFAASDRPQSIAEWRRLFDISLPFAHDAPTQKVGAAPSPSSSPASAPRLGGVNREEHKLLPPPESPRRSAGWLWLVLLLVVLAGGAALAWRYQDTLRELLAGVPAASTPTNVPSTNAPPAQTATPTLTIPPPTTAQPPTRPATKTGPATPPTPIKPPMTPTQPPQAASSGDAVAKQALIAQAERAAADARTVNDKAKDAAAAARSIAGEAKIVAARAAMPSLEKAERLSYPGGASYIGQVAAGQRQGLGVADLEKDEHQAGDWKDDQLNGLGTVRFGDGTHYEGQWKDGQSTGLGVREKPGVQRDEGNFVGGRLEGAGIRHLLGDTRLDQAGEWRADVLDGPGVETLPNGERYEGEFRAGKRHGYGQLIDADGKAHPGRWEDGKQVESTP
ncbi:MAG TPA: protein kinase [Reyranella sp.]|nr:protein kinase [Reyranella sp.]